jgi:signal transduction histidine kinase
METSLCLFRVVQEALHNVARHAEASKVAVSIHAEDGGLRAAVCDDGKGFDMAAKRRQPTLGLASMRERVHLLKGDLEIESVPGEGTAVLVWVPLNGESP